MLPPPTVFSSPLLTLDFTVYVSTPSFVSSWTDGRGEKWDKARYSPLCLGRDVHAFDVTARFRGGASLLSDVTDTLTQLCAAQAVFYL